MLVIANQYARRRATEPGADPGASGGSEEVEFAARNQSEVYQWTERILLDQEYHRLPKSGKGIVRQYIGKMTGRSRAQVARLIR